MYSLRFNNNVSSCSQSFTRGYVRIYVHIQPTRDSSKLINLKFKRQTKMGILTEI